MWKVLRPKEQDSRNLDSDIVGTKWIRGAAGDSRTDCFLSISFLFSLVTGCCYRILENPTISHQKNRPTREAVAHLLGVALVRYNHMFSKLPFAWRLLPALPFLPEYHMLVLPRCDCEDHPDAAALWAPAISASGGCESVGNRLWNEEHRGRDCKVTPDPPSFCFLGGVGGVRES